MWTWGDICLVSGEVLAGNHLLSPEIRGFPCLATPKNMEKAESYTQIVVTCTFSIYIYKYNIHIMSAHIWWFMMVPMDFPNLSTFHWATVGTLQAHFAPKPLPAAATRSLSAAVETVVVWTAGSNGDTQVVLNLVLNHPIRISHTKLYAVIMWNTNHPVEPYFFGGRSFQLLLTCCSLF